MTYNRARSTMPTTMSETTTTTTTMMSPGQAAQPTFTFRREVRIEWGDCDPAGIVFYPRYLAFFDANTAYLFEAAGLPKADLVRTYDIVGMPLVDVQGEVPEAVGIRRSDQHREQRRRMASLES